MSSAAAKKAWATRRARAGGGVAAPKPADVRRNRPGFRVMNPRAFAASDIAWRSANQPSAKTGWKVPKRPTTASTGLSRKFDGFIV